MAIMTSQRSYLMQSTYHQRGVVMLIAVFIVAIISGISIRFASEFQLSKAKAEQSS